MHAPVYALLRRRVGRLPNLLQEVRELVRRETLLQTAYGRPPQRGHGQRMVTTRALRFLDAKYGAGGASKRRLDWKQSSVWHYWIEGCLSDSSTRFRKYFRVTRTRFDEIYQAAADSGEFRLNPGEPLFDRFSRKARRQGGRPTAKGLSSLYENRCCSAPPSNRRAVFVFGNQLPDFKNRAADLLPQVSEMVPEGVLRHVCRGHVGCWF